MADGFDDAAAAIRAFFHDRMTAAYPSVPVQYSNQDFTPPDVDNYPVTGGTPDDLLASTWMQLAVIWADSRQADMAESPRYRSTGLVTVSVNVPRGSGDGLALKVANDVSTAFRRLRLDGNILFRGPVVRRVGPDGQWYKVNVTVPFHLDTVHTVHQS